ncbi:MAG: ArsA-related P-loop ATPase [Bryobacteraceae bacterium]
MSLPSQSAQSQIVVFCGKGGVGKTTVSLALALKRANEGRKVVVVSSHPLRELAVAVSLDGLNTRFPVAAANLFVVHLEPRDLIAEVVQKTFPMEWVVNSILSNRIYQSLIEVAPGLKEFYFLARLQQLAERRAEASGTPDFDLLFWDAPSTGHFLGTLRAARNFETFLSGPLAAAGADLARFFSNAARIIALPTTTLEEMAVTETLEMCAALEKEFQLAPSAVLLNMASPLVDAEATEIEKLQAAVGAPSREGMRFALDRGLLERARASDIASRLRVRMVTIERVRAWKDDLDLLDRIGQALGAAAPA